MDDPINKVEGLSVFRGRFVAGATLAPPIESRFNSDLDELSIGEPVAECVILLCGNGSEVEDPNISGHMLCHIETAFSNLFIH